MSQYVHHVHLISLAPSQSDASYATCKCTLLTHEGGPKLSAIVALCAPSKFVDTAGEWIKILSRPISNANNQNRLNKSALKKINTAKKDILANMYEEINFLYVLTV
jgi:hypothetical protein